MRAKASVIVRKVLALGVCAMTVGLAFAIMSLLVRGGKDGPWLWAHSPVLSALWVFVLSGGMLVSWVAAISHAWLSAAHGIVWKVFMTLGLVVGTPLAAIPYYLFEARWRARVMGEPAG
jgi:hypothetical protein